MTCPHCGKQMHRTWRGWHCVGCTLVVSYNSPERQAEVDQALLKAVGGEADEEKRKCDEIARRLIKEALGD